MGLFNFNKGKGAENAAGKDGGWFSNIFKKNELPAEKVEVETAGERVILKGEAPTQEAAEKMIIAAGNNEGVAEVESQLTVAEAAPEATMYEVQFGDSLSKIALAQYGDAMKYPAIFEANKPMLSDPDKIYPGQVLRIPPKEVVMA